MVAHAVELVVKPPGGAKLYLAGYAAVLEIARHGRHHLVLGGVDVVEDGARQLAVAVEGVEQVGQGLGRAEVADGVEARVGAEGGEAAAVGVAQGAEVELLCPSAAGIHAGQVEEQRRLQAFGIVGAERLSAAHAAEECGGLGCGAGGVGQTAHAVVGQTAALRVEEGVAAVEGGKQVGIGGDMRVAHLGQTVQIGVVGCGVGHGHGLVGAPGGQYLHLKTALGDVPVVLQSVGGVVGGAYRLDVVAAHEPACRVGRRGQQGVAAGVDVGGGVGAEQVGDAEGRGQFEVRPVVERVAQGVGQGLGPFLKLLPVGSVARDVALVHAVGPHGAPFVVVAAQPQFGDGGEAVVLGNHLRRQVAVEVDDGQRRRHVVVEVAGRVVAQQEVIVNEWCHDG